MSGELPDLYTEDGDPVQIDIPGYNFVEFVQTGVYLFESDSGDRVELEFYKEGER